MDDVPTDDVKQAMASLETGLQGREIEDLVSQFVFFWHNFWKRGVGNFHKHGDNQ